jgi:cytochrome P450 family 26 subfamily A
LKEIVHQKTVEQEKSGVNPRQDLISCLLSMVEDDKQVLTENEIIHNAMLVMVAGYDTSSVLITFIIRILANEPAICAAVLQGMHSLVSVCVCE